VDARKLQADLYEYSKRWREKRDKFGHVMLRGPERVCVDAAATLIASLILKLVKRHDAQAEPHQ
ncbi:MAG: hypothetical protein WAP47_18720, partial [Candidatus Rokuibacteriota bacterium]